MKTLKTILAVTLLLSIAALARGETYSIVHEFAGGALDGKNPQGSLTLSADGATLYGMTYLGGSEYGTIFRVNTNGTELTLLHKFAGGADDGAYPWGNLTLGADGYLYGMTGKGGSASGEGYGTIFKIDPASPETSYTVLHKFVGGADDGASPSYSSLTFGVDGKLYGMTRRGGDNDLGTIFKIDPGTGAFSLLHEFAGGVNDGQYPEGNLTLGPEGQLYGMTYQGGAGWGTIFEIDPVSTNMTPLHTFVGGSDDGASPYGSLTLSADGMLYGMTAEGGKYSMCGTIFEIDPDNPETTFALLHKFAGGADDGMNPFGDLTLFDGILYGMTRNGGDAGTGNLGTIFKIDPADPETSYAIIHEFAGGANDGALPNGSLIVSQDGKTLFGMTQSGGAGDNGLIFGYSLGGGGDVPEPSTLLLLLPFVGFGVRRLRRK